jgi:hypothetical protein
MPDDPETPPDRNARGRLLASTDQPDRPFCRWCEYELSGLADRSPCPECGRSQGADGPLLVRGWPAQRTLGLYLVWPALLWLIPLVGVVALPVHLQLWRLGVGVIAMVILGVCTIVPVLVAGTVSIECTVKSRREKVFFRLAAAGWGVNWATGLVALAFAYTLTLL